MIVTPVSEAGRFIEKYEIGYQYRPNQENDIYLKIIELRKNIITLKRLSENTRALKDKFSREKIAADFVKILEEKIQF